MTEYTYTAKTKDGQTSQLVDVKIIKEVAVQKKHITNNHKSIRNNNNNNSNSSKYYTSIDHDAEILNELEGLAFNGQIISENTKMKRVFNINLQRLVLKYITKILTNLNRVGEF